VRYESFKSYLNREAAVVSPFFLSAASAPAN